MHEEIKVIVITSCYNHEAYVAEAIQSVLSQTHVNFDFYIVNDGSEDNSAEVIKKYTYDTRLHFINLKKNTGAVGAFHILNRIIKLSDAKYVASMSTDDKWKPDKLEKQISFLESNHEYKAVFTWDCIIHEKSEAEYGVKDGYSHKENQDRYRWFRQFCYNGNCLNAVSSLVNREVYIELGGYDWTFRQLQDFNLWLRLCMKYPFYIIPEELTYYRRHNTNLSTRNINTVFVRSYNENYYIFRTLFRTMRDDFFKKCFCKDMVFPNVESSQEILAEKIVFLLQSNQSFKQIGMEMYIDNSHDEELMKILEDRYHLDIRTFHKITGQSGILKEIVNEENSVYQINQVSRLLDLVDVGNLENLELESFNYYVLAQIQQLTSVMDNGTALFYKFRDFIWASQDIGGDNKLCVILGEDTVDDSRYKSIIEKLLHTVVEAEVTFCPKTIHMFNSEFKKPDTDFEIFDEEEHRIKTFRECHRTPRRIIMAGCFGNEYPEEQLLLGISLRSKVYIINKEDDVADIFRKITLD